jgi:predicted PurR-regulated permease PerM
MEKFVEDQVHEMNNHNAFKPFESKTECISRCVKRKFQCIITFMLMMVVMLQFFSLVIPHVPSEQIEYLFKSLLNVTKYVNNSFQHVEQS